MCFKKNTNLKFYEQAVTAYPQITNQKITKDCEFIIMGCDGVWDCVDSQKLCEFVSQKLKTKMKISTIISEIFDKIISKTNNSKICI
jgi:serine/threonine protein phosphatase PrpC